MLFQYVYFVPVSTFFYVIFKNFVNNSLQRYIYFPNYKRNHKIFLEKNNSQKSELLEKILFLHSGINDMIANNLEPSAPIHPGELLKKIVFSASLMI